MTDTVTINGLRYHIRQNGQGAALLLLHGFTGTGETWSPVWARLAQNYWLIAPDLIGHGRTDAPATSDRYNMTAAAADLVALLDHLGVGCVHLLGYSMGGRLALYTALHYPARFRTLTLESASPGLRTTAERDDRRGRDDVLADRIEREGVTSFIDFWETLSLWESQQHILDDAAKAALRAERLSQRPCGLANSLRGMGTGVQPSLWERLPELTLPVQLIAGASDEKFVGINEAMCASLANAQLSIISQAGHTVHLEQPRRFQDIITAFLSEH